MIPMKTLGRSLAAVIVSAGIASTASAGPILSAVGVTATNSFPDTFFGNPDNLINHGGLLTDYTSGVTDFDTYIASNPMHTLISAGAEWFTDFNVPSAVLTFDLGAIVGIDGLAAWVDEHWGVGTIGVSLSVDGISYSSVGSFNPTDWAVGSDYGADVFSFGATSARYVQLALGNCPQPLSVEGGGCGMGEVAFRAAAVPEPGTLGLLGLALVGLGFVRRRAAAR
jgi:hypothetical protein